MRGKVLVASILIPFPYIYYFPVALSNSEAFVPFTIIGPETLAGSRSMLEDSAYLGKPVKNSSAERLPLKYIVRDSDSVSKQRKGRILRSLTLGWNVLMKTR